MKPNCHMPWDERSQIYFARRRYVLRAATAFHRHLEAGVIATPDDAA